MQPKNCNSKAKAPSFKGLTQGVIGFWQFVDAHGRAMQFTVEDMAGTNIPRSAKGLLAGKKYTGRVNIPAFLQEALREFLTGPTMCTIPVVILTLAKKSGKTANTHIENIRNLSYLMEKNIPKEGQNLEDAFYSGVIKDMFSATTGKNADDKTVKKMIDIYKRYGKETNKKEQSKILNEAQKLYELTVKNTLDNHKDVSSTPQIYKGIDFLETKFSKSSIGSDGKNIKGATKFKNYVGYTTSYFQDFTKKFGNIASKENIESFKHTWIFKRFATLCGMIFITGILMFQIPKLYTLASGKVNPNASAIYNEADKIKGGSKKENK